MSHTLSVGEGRHGRVLAGLDLTKTVCFLTVLCSDLAKATQSLTRVFVALLCMCLLSTSGMRDIARNFRNVRCVRPRTVRVAQFSMFGKFADQECLEFLGWCEGHWKEEIPFTPLPPTPPPLIIFTHMAKQNYSYLNVKQNYCQSQT